MKTKSCELCGEKYTPGARNYTRARTCSGRCNLKLWRKEHPEHNRRIKMEWRRRSGVLEFGSKEHRESVAEKLRGKKLSDGTIDRMKSSARRGTLHPAWKGSAVGYRALHRWVELYLGKPDKCNSCGQTGLSGKKIHWSNKSGEYRRDLGDWQRLCAKCHREYDLTLKERIAILS